MKKRIAFLLVFVLTLAILLPTAFAANASPSPSTSPDASASPSPSTSPDASASPSEDTTDKPTVKADSALLIDVKTKAVLLEKDPDKQIVPASTTKILTSLLVLEKVSDLSKEVVCGNDVMGGLNKESSLLYAKDGLKPGEKMSIKDLLYGMMVISGNDAANALAREVSGSIADFVQLMNTRAQELGMTNTLFTNPHGLDIGNPHSTANDMAKLTLAALTNAKWKDVFTTKKYNLPATNKHDARELDTTDKLMSSNPEDQEYHYDPVKGGKTGLTTNKGNNGCIVAYAEKDGRQLLCLIFGDHDSNASHRFVLAKTLFEWGFSQAAPVDISAALEGFTVTATVKNIADTEDNEVDLAPDLSKGFIYTGKTEDIANKIKNNLQNLSGIPEYNKELKAPLKQGEVVGTITMKYLDEPLGIADLIVTRDVAAPGEDVSSASSSNSPSSPVQPQPTKELFTGGTISPWWWLLIPAILGAIILLRVMRVNKRQRSRFKNKRKVYNYRIK